MVTSLSLVMWMSWLATQAAKACWLAYILKIGTILSGSVSPCWCDAGRKPRSDVRSAVRGACRADRRSIPGASLDGLSVFAALRAARGQAPRLAFAFSY